MSKWIEFEPRNGWDSFADSKALSAALWDTLNSANWHYTNFTSESSLWESRADASFVSVEYKGELVTLVAAQTGAAFQAVSSLAEVFSLCRVV